ncbi:MAG: ADP-ribosylglycohydrolase family protein [Chloroflexota bacterium]
MTIPADYDERVYAGVLGKIIGVYLGRPVEGWTYERIAATYGDITGYVHGPRDRHLVLTDDDISGTFTFFRALEDSDFDPEISAESIGNAWLNYLIEHRTVLWWGGLGNSTEHTAYLRLKAGIKAPRSGSIQLNDRLAAEAIGAQIFIDAWAMVSPGDPERAAAMVRRAASVSHDGEALHAAALLAAMEATAFVERGVARLLTQGLRHIPADSAISRLALDMLEWRSAEPDWRMARRRLVDSYGEDRYGGNVHIVPQHGLVLLGLLWGDDDFSRSLSIVNTAGGDTDCNSGNVGCVLGIMNGLAGMDGAYDWRSPVGDRIYLPSAEGGRGVTDAVAEAGRIAAAGRRLSGSVAVRPKGGARFHFSFPGSVQRFECSVDEGTALPVTNVPSEASDGTRVLAVPFLFGAGGMTRATTSTFIPPSAIDLPGYMLVASPSVHSGQRLRASIRSSDRTTNRLDVRLIVGHYTGADHTAWIGDRARPIMPSETIELEWLIPDTGGQPIMEVGVEIRGQGEGSLHIDWLTWDGMPTVTLGRPADGGTMWRRAWVNGFDGWETYFADAFRLTQNRGTGLLIQGSLDWADYVVESVVRPLVAEEAGIAARVGGMRRYYALLLGRDGVTRLVRACDEDVVLAEADVQWEAFRSYRLEIRVFGRRIVGLVDGTVVADVIDDGAQALRGGGVALICREGALSAEQVTVRAATPGESDGA